MMDNQFNPFIRENLPPIINGIAIETFDKRGYCDGIVDYWCRKATYTRIWIDVIDVSWFTIIIKINDDDERSRTFETWGGRQDFHTSFDLSGWEILNEYTVNLYMTDLSGNELDPPFEETVRGVLGEIAKRLEDIWNWLCGVVSDIVDAIMEALDFLRRIMMDILRDIFRDVLIDFSRQTLGATEPDFTSFGEFQKILNAPENAVLIALLPTPEALALLFDQQMLGYMLRTIGLFLLALVFMMTGILSPADVVESLELAVEEVPHSTNWYTVAAGLIALGTCVLILIIYLLAAIATGGWHVLFHSWLLVACGIGILLSIGIIIQGLNE